MDIHASSQKQPTTQDYHKSPNARNKKRKIKIAPAFPSSWPTKPAVADCLVNAPQPLTTTSATTRTYAFSRLRRPRRPKSRRLPPLNPPSSRSRASLALPQKPAVHPHRHPQKASKTPFFGKTPLSQPFCLPLETLFNSFASKALYYILSHSRLPRKTAKRHPTKKSPAPYSPNASSPKTHPHK